MRSGLRAFTIVGALCALLAVVAAATAQDFQDTRPLLDAAREAYDRHDDATAERLFERLLVLQEASVGSEAPDTVRTVLYLQAIFQAQDRQSEADRVLQRSVSAALLRALNDGDAERALALLDRGADPNARDLRGWTALMYAGLAGRTRALRALLARGADVNVRCPGDGATALLNAVQFGDPEAVRLLLAAGASVSVADNDGTTALALARRRLAHSPADRRRFPTLPPRMPDGDLTFATQHEYTEVVALLKAAGARD